MLDEYGKKLVRQEDPVSKGKSKCLSLSKKTMLCSAVAMAMEAKEDDAAALEMVTFTIIIDDIVFPDGRTSMACLGGGGPQTAFGALLWLSNRERVGLASGVGEDFPDSCRHWLETAGVDTGGLVLWPSATLRAWQVLEEDGRRVEVWRVPVGEEVWGMLRPEMNLLPPLYQKAKTYHAGVHPSGLDIGFLRELRNSGAEVVSVEVYTHAEEVVPHSELQGLVSTGHIFSPNEREAASLVGPGLPLELIERLSELGAEIVVLRRGHLGCIVHRSDTKETWDVPAFHTVFQEGRKSNGDMIRTEVQKPSLEGMNVKDVLDPTGCGNTFCGGFLVGWYRTRDLLTAALWGSVSASFMLEYEGIPPPLVSEWRTAAQLRLELLQPLAKQWTQTRTVSNATASVQEIMHDIQHAVDFLAWIEDHVNTARSHVKYEALSGTKNKPIVFCGATHEDVVVIIFTDNNGASGRRIFVKEMATHINGRLHPSLPRIPPPSAPHLPHAVTQESHDPFSVPNVLRPFCQHYRLEHFDTLEAGYNQTSLI